MGAVVQGGGPATWPLGFLAFSVVYILAAVLLVPVWPLSISGGLAFGLWGFVWVPISATLGAAAAFLISRYLAREKIREWLVTHPRFVLFGLTAMMSRYAKGQPGDAHGMPWISKVFPRANVRAFDIYFWCGVIALFSVGVAGLATLA